MALQKGKGLRRHRECPVEADPGQGLSDEQRCVRRDEAETGRDAKSKTETWTMRVRGMGHRDRAQRKLEGKGRVGMTAEPGRGGGDKQGDTERGESAKVWGEREERTLSWGTVRDWERTRGRSSLGQQRARGFHPLLAGAWRCRKEDRKSLVPRPGKGCCRKEEEARTARAALSCY